jgi:uncharacterized membrane protein
VHEPPPPSLGTATTAGAVMHALAQESRQFGFYVLAFLLTGGLWIEHHQLLDPLETHSRRLPRVNLWFLLSVSLLPYFVSVLAAYPGNSAASGLFVLWLGVAQFAFLLLCLFARRELGAGAAIDQLIVPKVIRAGSSAVLLVLLGGVLVAQVKVPDAVIFAWLILLVVWGRLAVRFWSVRHQRER